MQSLTSFGLKVSAESFYQNEVSKPDYNEFMFAYRITIENNSENVVKLVKRKWVITDAFCRERIVEGEGVVGRQPIIKPNCSYQYVSGCHLKTDIGKMSGEYIMQKVADSQFFEVKIPPFNLIAPFKLN